MIQTESLTPRSFYIYISPAKDLRYQIIQPVMSGIRDCAQEGFEACYPFLVVFFPDIS